jgi:hypothetical protein
MLQKNGASSMLQNEWRIFDAPKKWRIFDAPKKWRIFDLRS